MTAPYSSSLTTHRQGYDYSATYVTDEGVSVRVTIHTDAYEFQSRSKAEVWSPATLSWNEAAKLPYGEMESAGVSDAVRRDKAARLIGLDEDRLLAETTELPGVGRLA